MMAISRLDEDERAIISIEGANNGHIPLNCVSSEMMVYFHRQLNEDDVSLAYVTDSLGRQQQSKMVFLPVCTLFAGV